MDEYKNMSVHAQDLEGGRILAPGESAELSADAQKEPFNKALIEDNVLVKQEKSGQGRTSKGEEE